MSEAPEDYWKRMAPEIDRRFKESLARIAANIRANKSPLELLEEKLGAERRRNTAILQELSAIISALARESRS